MATITKEYTVNVPDELWVDSWDNNNTATYTYEGPATVYATIRGDGISTVSVEPINAEEHPGERVIEIDANVQPDVADWIHPTPEDFSHTHTTETNPDGSTWERITNPGIRDWFELAPATPNEDGREVELVAIIKDPDTQYEIKVRERKAYVKKYDDAYDFDADTQATIDTFLAACDTYLSDYAPIYPWKYVTVPEGSMPKIPAVLISTFNNLPEIN
jgi:hypothetical protein